MREICRASERGHFDFGWLDTHHSFSFGEFHDPARMGWRSLRVLNEDRVQPGRGFGTHGHRDMEILTWVLEGSLEHRDSLGTNGVIRPGDAQIMSAGSGIRHSEFNGSNESLVHFLQIWILPDREGLPPRYDQIAFDDRSLRNRWKLVAGPSSTDDCVKVFQDVRVSVARMDPGCALVVEVPEGRFGYLQVARGSIQSAQESLEAGDAIKFSAEAGFHLKAGRSCELLLFDLA